MFGPEPGGSFLARCVSHGATVPESRGGGNGGPGRWDVLASGMVQGRSAGASEKQFLDFYCTALFKADSQLPKNL